VYSIKPVFAFLNYREFLADAVEERRQAGSFSHRKFAQAAGFSSPNFVLLLIQGKRNLAEAGARKIAKALKLSPAETTYFFKLVQANQAKTAHEKVNLMQALVQDAGFLRVQPLSEAQFEYYKNWYNIPVRELLLINAKATPEWIAEVLNPRVEVERIRESLEVLEKLGLIARAKDSWKVKDAVVASGNEVFSAGLLAFHQEMLRLARESLDRYRGADREVSSVTLSLSEEKFQFAREKIRALKKEILAMGDGGEAADRLFQMNFQVFPLSQNLKKEKS
jgi:uncharacterized protein (TIGR02147 family)